MKKKSILGVAVLVTLFMGSASAAEKTEKAYQAVLNDYEKITRTSVASNGTAEAVANELYGKLNQDLSYWTIANIASNPEKLVYSYKDLDGRREEELLIGILQSDNNVVPVALYYIS